MFKKTKTSRFEKLLLLSLSSLSLGKTAHAQNGAEFTDADWKACVTKVIQAQIATTAYPDVVVTEITSDKSLFFRYSEFDFNAKDKYGNPMRGTIDMSLVHWTETNDRTGKYVRDYYRCSLDARKEDPWGKNSKPSEMFNLKNSAGKKIVQMRHPEVYSDSG